MVKKSVSKEKLNFEIPAFILGTISLVFALTLTSPIAGLVLGVLGIVFSLKQKSLFSRRAFIISIIGVALSFLTLLWAVLMQFNLI